MAGSLIRILPRTDFTASPVGTSVIETVIVPLVNAVPFVTFVGIAKIHAKSGAGGTAQTVSILFKNFSPSDSDPAADFTGATLGTATFTLHSTSTGAMTPQIIQLATPMAQALRITMQTSQVTAGTAFTFSLSIDGLGRE